MRVDGVLSQQLEHVRQAFPRFTGKTVARGTIRQEQFVEGRKHTMVIEQLVCAVLDAGKIFAMGDTIHGSPPPAWLAYDAAGAGSPMHFHFHQPEALRYATIPRVPNRSGKYRA